MEFKCSKEELVKVIGIVQKAISQKASLQIMECIKIDAEGDTLTFTGNNMEICIEYKIKADIKEEGSVALESKMFGEIIRKLPDGIVDINVNEQNFVTIIRCGKAKINIQGEETLSFPAMPEFKEQYRFTINQDVLRKMIKRTIYAVSNGESKHPILTGLCFDIETGVLTMVGSDGYRIAVTNHTVGSSLEDKRFVVPGSTMRELMKILESGEDTEIGVAISDRHIMFEFESFKFVARLLEGEYIKYKSVLLTPNSITVSVKSSQLCESLDRASLLINDYVSSRIEKVPVKMSISYDKIVLDCMTSKGQINDVVDANVLGGDIRIGFNYKYLLDAIRACEEEEIKISLSNPMSPCFIQSPDESKQDYLYMILPVRLYEN